MSYQYLQSQYPAGNIDQVAMTSMCHLSDGTLIIARQAPPFGTLAPGAVYLLWSTDHKTLHQIDVIGTSLNGSTEFNYNTDLKVLVDSDDNIYVLNLDNIGSALKCKAYKKGEGYTWAPQPFLHGSWSLHGSTELEAVWCDSGGGTDSKGHIFGTTTGPSYFILDAGAALRGSGTLINEAADLPTFLGMGSYAAFRPYALDIAQSADWALSGVACITRAPTGGFIPGVTLGRWAIDSAGHLITNAVTNQRSFGAPGHYDPPDGLRQRLIRYDVDSYLWIYPSVGAGNASKLQAIRVSSTALIDATPTTWGTVPGWNDGLTLTHKWEAFLDPAFATPRVFLIAPSVLNERNIHRLGITGMLTGPPTWASTVSTLQTSEQGIAVNNSWPVANLDLSVVKRPRGGFADWGVSSEITNPSDPSTKVSAFLGSYTFFFPRPPTNLSPGQGKTVDTDLPKLTGTVQSGVPVKIEYQIANDSAFTTDVRTIAEPDSSFRENGANTITVPTDQQLFQDGWYLRARSVAEDGAFSAWVYPGGSPSSAIFIVSHPPSATNLSPVDGSYAPWNVTGTQFSWDFADTSPVDFQTAYQIIVEKNSDSSSVIDTGKVTGNPGELHMASLAIGALFKEILLKWKIKLWDRDNQDLGQYSTYRTFTVADPATVSIVAPTAGATITAPSFDVSWLFSPPAGSSRTQAKWQVVVRNATTGVIAVDSGLQNGPDSTYTVSKPGAIKNNTDYTVTVKAIDSAGIEVTTSVIAFSTQWTIPASPAFSVITDFYDSAGYVTVSWSNTPRDADWSLWRVYRSPHGTEEWTLLVETDDELASFWLDYTAPSMTQLDYLVVQVADRFGDLIESSYTPFVNVTPVSTHYLLVHPFRQDLTMFLRHVSEDSFNDEYEQNTTTLIGRGRKVDYGTRYGYAGSLTAELRDEPNISAREQRLALEALKRQRLFLKLRTPFGDIWNVAAGDLQVKRVAGVGQREFVDVTIPYTEVT